MIRAGDVDTVIVGITDMQGRLQGKRLDATYFIDELHEGIVDGSRPCGWSPGTTRR
jgi:glutamine synthetase